MEIKDIFLQYRKVYHLFKIDFPILLGEVWRGCRHTLQGVTANEPKARERQRGVSPYGQENSDQRLFRVKRRIFLYCIVITASLLLFLNLGNQYLWQDEADCAVLGVNILRYGFPRCFDGKNLVPSNVEYGKNYLWISLPWLQNYLAAASFALLGKNNFTARFPFVLLGLGSILLTYFLALRLFGNRRIAQISILLLSVSIPYLLHIRQCRYYAPVIFFTLWSIIAYLRFIEGRKIAALEFVVALVLLFHSNIGLFFPIICTVGGHYLKFNLNRKDTIPILWTTIAIAILTVPFFIYIKGWQFHTAGFSLLNMRHNAQFYLREINKFVFPIGFFGTIGVIFFICKKHILTPLEIPILTGKTKFLTGLTSLSEKEKRSIWLLISVVIISYLFAIFAKQRTLRYMIQTIPFLMIIEAFILERWMRKFKLLTSLLIFILVWTNVLHYSLPYFILRNLGINIKGKGQFRSYLVEFIYELTHDYDGPIEGIVAYLKQHATPGQTVQIYYGDCAVMFYTDLIVHNDKTKMDAMEADWIIPRRNWFYSSEYVKRLEKTYQKIVINYPDIPWENRPDDLGYHRFRTDTTAPQVTIYKKIKTTW